jgi:hypothetical protein
MTVPAATVSVAAVAAVVELMIAAWAAMQRTMLCLNMLI